MASPPSSLGVPSAMAASSSRPVSVAVHPSPAPSAHPSRRQQRASHSVATSSQREESPSNSPYQDVYHHPAVEAYMAAHPRRTIPKFGNYLLLQTLGEGEFGKVKLGIHVEWGEEVAVKLIRRGNVDNPLRLSKVEREIDVLRALKHPNIVRLYDVIETDKYIGIILEYASGGELFDHILAHRYLKEKDAARLFSQLISGVWYIHQKKIVHRDLKLENLLLDRNRNVIITDFGFANRFEHKADDLMQTSCGSPCYAAPELVISEGLYVGSAVDIWSCGVILYAMLAGYLPFDDDPANPDGDNINLLYKYIVSTPLSFPEYISADARDLLSMMLVPDPSRRANLDGVMRHRWLAAHAGTPRTDGHPNAFGRIVEELERAALDQHRLRRLAYHQQMRAAAMAQTLQPAGHGREATHTGVTSPGRPTQPEFIYESSAADQSSSAATKNVAPATPNGGTVGKNPTYGSPSAHGITSDDPFAPPPGQPSSLASATMPAPSKASDEKPTTNGSPNGKSHKQNSSSGGGGFRHTIQVEYDEAKASGRRSEERRGRSNTGQSANVKADVPPQPVAKDRRASIDKPTKPTAATSAPGSSSKRSSQTTTTSPPKKSPQNGTPSKSPRPPSHIPTPIPKTNKPTVPDIIDTPQEVRRQPSRLVADKDKEEKDSSTGSVKSSVSKKNGQGHKKGRSLDKFALGKLFGAVVNGGSGSPASPVVDSSTTPATTYSSATSAGAASLLNASPDNKDKEKEDKKKKSRRNTLTVMVEPISRTIRGKTMKSKTSAIPSEQMTGSVASLAPPLPSTPTPNSTINSSTVSQSIGGNASGSFVLDGASVGEEGTTTTTTTTTQSELGNPASSGKAKKVMAWFRTKSKGRDSMGVVQPSMVSMENEEVGGPGQVVEVQQQSSGGGGGGGPALVLTTPMATMTHVPPPATPIPSGNDNNNTNSSRRSSRNVSPRTQKTGSVGLTQPKRTASSTTENSAMFSTPNFVQKFRNSVTVGAVALTKSTSQASKQQSQQSQQQQQQQQKQQKPHEKLRIHHGAVDQTMITTRPPGEVMNHVRDVLSGMGMEIMLESEFKYRCVRQKRRKGVVGVQATQIGGGEGNTGNGREGEEYAAVTMLGSAASNGVDRRGLPIPSQTSFGATGSMLRGLLMRRQSSQTQTTSQVGGTGSGVSTTTTPLAFDDEHSVLISPDTPSSEGISGTGTGIGTGTQAQTQTQTQTQTLTQSGTGQGTMSSSTPTTVVIQETIYGDVSQDAGDEVRFSVELTRIDRLNDTFSLDIRRLKGNLRSYKFLYDTIRQRADLQRLGVQ
ncbi:hypothetical protein Agabi119p4_11587 [Agaricus bisporus var. burnettii]|uniref:non-specific serine/threonine protein kinase n=2 Tax=Agaricus bisporus var. burnettii TaxID=192524 RepID=A0A8H7BZK3_AGABI|nr:hypothetical protein Agabi119p4_11587 [Agaricus bisporus var. burnettii]